MERSGNDSTDKGKSAIQKYCEACRRQVSVSEYQEYEDHLNRQDEELEIIKRQSKPQFGRDVLANVVGSASYDILLGVLKRLVR